MEEMAAAAGCCQAGVDFGDNADAAGGDLCSQAEIIHKIARHVCVNLLHRAGAAQSGAVGAQRVDNGRGDRDVCAKDRVQRQQIIN